MREFQERVVDERHDLSEKIKKLTTFFGTRMFESLDPAERERMERQVGHMEAYRDVLTERINHF
jgi:hypothetical protein